MAHKISVIVPCKNEQHNIRQCIASCHAIADEVLIADSGSTDATLEIAATFPKVRIIEREYRTSGDFKNWAIPQAAHQWILLLDADERLTPELESEIVSLLETEPECDGYWMYRANHFMGHPVPYGDSSTDKVIRLFKRDLCRYEGPSDHGEVAVSSGKVGTLKSKLLHYTVWNYDQLFHKYHRYTSLQAQQWHQAGKDTSYFKLLVRPAFRFFREYILQFGFLNGKAGAQLAMLAAFYSFTKQARLWELNHGLPQPLDETVSNPAAETALEGNQESDECNPLDSEDDSPVILQMPRRGTTQGEPKRRVA